MESKIVNYDLNTILVDLAYMHSFQLPTDLHSCLQEPEPIEFCTISKGKIDLFSIFQDELFFISNNNFYKYTEKNYQGQDLAFPDRKKFYGPVAEKTKKFLVHEKNVYFLYENQIIIRSLEDWNKANEIESIKCLNDIFTDGLTVFILSEVTIRKIVGNSFFADIVIMNERIVSSLAMQCQNDCFLLNLSMNLGIYDQKNDETLFVLISDSPFDFVYNLSDTLIVTLSLKKSLVAIYDWQDSDTPKAYFNVPCNERPEFYAEDNFLFFFYYETGVVLTVIYDECDKRLIAFNWKFQEKVEKVVPVIRKNRFDENYPLDGNSRLEFFIKNDEGLGYMFAKMDIENEFVVFLRAEKETSISLSNSATLPISQISSNVYAFSTMSLDNKITPGYATKVPTGNNFMMYSSKNTEGALNKMQSILSENAILTSFSKIIKDFDSRLPGDSLLFDKLSELSPSRLRYSFRNEVLERLLSEEKALTEELQGCLNNIGKSLHSDPPPLNQTSYTPFS